jgi:hypothetical protein
VMVVGFFRFRLVFVWVVVVVLFVVEDFVGGERVGEVVKIGSSDNDLFTAWILRLFLALFTYVGVAGSVSFSASDDTGTARTFVLKGSYSGDFFVFNTYACVQGVRVRYGMSSTPASRTDNRLLQEIYVDGNPRVVIDESRGFVMIESVVSFGADTAICEVGLSMAVTVAGDRTCGEVLIDRTVYDTCRSIPAGTPYTVRYRVQL